jgi:hypothetical protein
MHDEAFAAYVLSNAPRYEIETLEKIARGLSDHIASRRWGKPEALKVGSKIEATMFDAPITQYGEIVALLPKSCKIRACESEYISRIQYQKYAIRVVDDFEWNRVCMSLSERHKEVTAELAAEARDRKEARRQAILNREKAARRPRRLQASNGAIDLFVGAYVHAFSPDGGIHEYGVVVHATPKSIILSSEESDYESRVWATSNEIYLLTDQQWLVVDAEHRRRNAEYEEAKKNDDESALPDYYGVEIPLQTVRL